MRTWTRAHGDGFCGGPCGRQLRRGDPILVIQVTGISRKHQRCVQCAGEPAPPDLPLLIERSTPAPFKPMSRLTDLPFDYTARLLGERDV